MIHTIRCTSFWDFLNFTHLYNERRVFVPAEPKKPQDIDLTKDLFIVDETTNESMIKGDAMISEDKRVIMSTTNDLLEILSSIMMDALATQTGNRNVKSTKHKKDIGKIGKIGNECQSQSMKQQP